MASTLEIPVNNLGSYLTKKNKLNVDLYAKTSISTVELSKLRNGLIKSLDARKLYLILKAADLKLSDSLKEIYPTVTIIDDTVQAIEDIFDFFDSVEVNTIAKISSKTGIPISRLKSIKRGLVNPAGHELFLIELATKSKPGTLFTILFKDLELNSTTEEARLRKSEKEKSSKKA